MEEADTMETNSVTPEEVQSYLEAGRAKQLSRERFLFHNW